MQGFNSFGLHSQSSKRSLPLHASYCCMWFTCFPFSTEQVNQLSDVYKQETSSITWYKQQHASLKNSLTFEQETSSIMWYKQQHASLKNSLTFEQETFLNRTKINCKSIVNCKFCFYSYLSKLPYY